MRVPAWLFLLIVSASPVAVQSSGAAAGLIGDAFKSALARTETVPEEDRRALFAHASVVMKNLGGSTFKTPLPGNVIDRGIIPWILSHNTHESFLSGAAMDVCK